jgi:hypothetical protein
MKETGMAERASSVAKTSSISDAYRIDSLAKTKAPEGAGGKDWYRYVIIQGDNTIVGHRQGSQRAVKQAVDELVVRLNERRSGKPGRVHLTSSAKKKK